MPNYTTTGHQPIITWVKYHSYYINSTHSQHCILFRIQHSIVYSASLPFYVKTSWNLISTVSLGPIDVIRVKSYVLLSSFGYADDLVKA